MSNTIITINREFGSGGREIGKRLADLLEIPYYDREIVTQIAQRTQLAEEYVEQMSESGPRFSFPITIGNHFYPSVDQSMTQANTIYAEQSKILTEISEKSDCIIVGRCANYVLESKKPLRIFIYADMDAKIARCRVNAPEDENLNDKQMKQKINGIDKDRASYYKFVTGSDWADHANYDLCINTSNISSKQAAQIIAQFVAAFKGEE